MTESRCEQAVVGLAMLLVVIPGLFVPSLEARAEFLAWFGLTAVVAGAGIGSLRRAVQNAGVRMTLVFLLAAYAASFVGGVMHGEGAGEAGLAAARGLVAVLGLGVLVWVATRPPWKKAAGWFLVALVAILAVGSLLGHFVFTRWHQELNLLTPHMHPLRIGLVWPTRLLTVWGLGEKWGSQYWDHTNIGAFIFSGAWVMLVDRLHRRQRFARAGWLLAFLLGVAVFLTASRCGWLMMLLPLPLICAYRGWRYAGKLVGLLALSAVVGYAGVEYTSWRLAKIDHPSERPLPKPGEIHVSGLIKRGSSGRLAAYEILWNDLEDSRWTGHGLHVTRTPVDVLLHEHSSYLATMRGGGLVALGAHLALLALALAAAARLAVRGCRWPLLLLATVMTGLLFDRSTVFRLTSFDEFPAHWLAVWIPLMLWARYRQQGNIGFSANCPFHNSKTGLSSAA